MTATTEAPPGADAMVRKRAIAFIAHQQTTGLKRPRLGLRSEFGQADLDALHREMPSGKWHPRKLMWSWPLTTRSCRRLRAVYGDGLTIRPELNAWYRTEVAAEEQRERVRSLQIAQQSRLAEEQSRLAQERALFGTVSYAVAPQMGVGAPLSMRGRPESFLDVPRTAPIDCSPVDTSRFRLPPAGPRLDTQLIGASWLAENEGGVEADEVGLGKSLTALMAILDGEHALLGPHLILAPKKAAQRTWPVELAKWVKPGEVIIPQWRPGLSGAGWRDMRARSIAQCEAAAGKDRPTVLVVNFDALRNGYAEWLQGVEWASIVVDEADQLLSVGHRGCGEGTMNAIEAMKLRTLPGGRRIPMTGTPFRGRLRNAWGLIDFVHQGAVGPSRKDFAGHLTQRASEEGGGATLDRVRIGMEVHWSRVMQDWFLRRTRTAQQRLFIEKRVETVTPFIEQKRQDENWRGRELWQGPHLETDEFEKVDNGRGGSVMRRRQTGVAVPDVIVAVSRRLQLAVGELEVTDDPTAEAVYAGPSPKVDRIIELLSDWGLLDVEWWWMAGEHGKCIIASPWTSGLDLVQKRLEQLLPPSAILRIDGKTTPGALDTIVTEFSGPRGAGILLLSSGAGGASLTLDEHCDRMIIMSEHWVDDTQKQVIGRIENRTADRRREIVLLRSDGMLDTYLGGRTDHQERTGGSMLALARA